MDKEREPSVEEVLEALRRLGYIGWDAAKGNWVLVWIAVRAPQTRRDIQRLLTAVRVYGPRAAEATQAAAKVASKCGPVIREAVLNVAAGAQIAAQAAASAAQATVRTAGVAANGIGRAAGAAGGAVRGGGRAACAGAAHAVRTTGDTAGKAATAAGRAAKQAGGAIADGVRVAVLAPAAVLRFGR